MTLTFKDSDGVEWHLEAWPCTKLGERPVPQRYHRHATEADLLSALGQLSTGSDGPTDAFNAKVWRRIAETVQDELAATKARLAEVTDNHAVIVNERDLFARQSVHFEGQYLSATAKLAEAERERDRMKEERDQERSRGNDHLDAFARKDTTLRARLFELQKAQAELASARRVVEAATLFWRRGDAASSKPSPPPARMQTGPRPTFATRSLPTWLRCSTCIRTIDAMRASQVGPSCARSNTCTLKQARRSVTAKMPTRSISASLAKKRASRPRRPDPKPGSRGASATSMGPTSGAALRARPKNRSLQRPSVSQK